VTLAAAGTVQAPRQVALDLAAPGRLADVAVVPGQTVAAGQLLAAVDPTSALVALSSARANLTAAGAQLLQLRAGPPAAARRQVRVSLAQDRQVLATAAQSLRDARAAAAQDTIRLQAAVTQAAARVDADQADLASAQATLQADETTLGSDRTNAAAAAGQSSSDRTQLSTDQARLLADQKKQNDDQASSAPAATLAADANAVLGDQAAVTNDQQKLSDDASAAANANAAVAADESRTSADRQTLATAATQLAADQDAATNALDAQAAGAVSARQSLHTAAGTVASARLGLGAGRAAAAVELERPRSGTLASERAAVRVAEAAVTSAEQALRATRLTAPFGGTVAAVNGVRGQLTPTQSGLPLIMLVDLRQLTVTASFDAAEAVLLTPGQPATITVPALAGQTLSGRVLTVSPLPNAAAPPTASSASTRSADTPAPAPTDAPAPATYTATIALDDAPAHLWPGMQAQVAVRVAAELSAR